jgi:hypothetical protein
MVKILGRQIGRELLLRRKPVPLSEEQMAQIKKGNYSLIQSYFGRDYKKFITEGEYENNDLLICDQLSGQWPGRGMSDVGASPYKMRVASGYLSLVFLTWNYTYIKAEYAESASELQELRGFEPFASTTVRPPHRMPPPASSTATPRPTSWRYDV